MNSRHKIEKNDNVKKIRTLLIITVVFIWSIPLVIAHCPLCTGATIVGIGVTRALGLDDSIVGVFVGGMIISTALWIDNILRKKNIGTKGDEKLRLLSLIILTTILTLVSFYYAGLIGRGNSFRIFGVESILVGSLSGGIVSLGAFYYSNHLKNKNGGEVMFSYQTMIISLVALIANAGFFVLIL